MRDKAASGFGEAAKALAAAGPGGDSVDQSMTINLQTPDVDTALQESKTGAQRGR